MKHQFRKRKTKEAALTRARTKRIAREHEQTIVFLVERVDCGGEACRALLYVVDVVEMNDTQLFLLLLTFAAIRCFCCRRVS